MAIETQAPYSILHANAAWSSVTGYSCEEARGKTCKALLHGPLTSDEHADKLIELAEAGDTSAATLFHYGKGGQVFLSQVTVFPLVKASKGGVEMYIARVRKLDMPPGSSVPGQQLAASSAKANASGSRAPDEADETEEREDAMPSEQPGKKRQRTEASHNVLCDAA